MLLLYAWPGNVRELINVRGELLALGFQQGLRDRLLRTTFFQASGPSTDIPGSPVAATALLEQKPAEEAPTATSKPKKAKVRLTAETLCELLIKHDGKLLPIANETGWDSHTLRDWVAKYNLGHLRKKEA
jgi:DNA-binding NtrC family response regulator